MLNFVIQAHLSSLLLAILNEYELLSPRFAYMQRRLSRVKSCCVIACCLACDVDKRGLTSYRTFTEFLSLPLKSLQIRINDTMTQACRYLMRYLQLCKQARQFNLKNDNLGEVNRLTLFYYILLLHFYIIILLYYIFDHPYYS